MPVKTQPLISVITITFNAEDTILPTLCSLQQQTFDDFEHIIIDGASSDNTLDLIKGNGGKNVSLTSEPDDGLYDAMNKGLSKAKGKYVIFLNSGDTFHDKETLKNYARYALDEDADIIYGDTIIVNKERKFIAPRHHSAPLQLTRLSFSKGMLICHQAFMVKKELAPYYDLKYNFSADYDWTLKCIEKTKPSRCKNLGIVTVDYLNDGLTDRNKLKSLIERFRIMSKHYGMPMTLFRHFQFLFKVLLRRARSMMPKTR